MRRACHHETLNEGIIQIVIQGCLALLGQPHYNCHVSKVCMRDRTSINRTEDLSNVLKRTTHRVVKIRGKGRNPRVQNAHKSELRLLSWAYSGDYKHSLQLLQDSLHSLDAQLVT